MAFEREILQILSQQQKSLVGLADQISEISISTNNPSLLAKLRGLKKKTLNHELAAGQLIAALEANVNSSVPPVAIIDNGNLKRNSIQVIKDNPFRSVIGILILIATILHREIPEWVQKIWQ